MWPEFILLMIGAYLLGSVPTAYLAAKWYRGIDIREHGTGNVGSANVMASTSRWLAIPVALFDTAKGAFTVWCAQLLGLSPAMQMAVGAITIVGHNWPLFLKFRGGKGILTSLGVIAMISPRLGFIILIVPYLLAPIRQIALGVFFGLVCLPLLSWFLSQPLDIDARLPVTLGFVAISGIAFVRRLAVPRSEISHSVPTSELLLYRLLFDRDIRDRKAWINRHSIGRPKT